MRDLDKTALQAIATDMKAGMNVLSVSRDAAASRAAMDDFMLLYGRELGPECTPANKTVRLPNRTMVRFIGMDGDPEWCRGFMGVVHLMPTVNTRDPRWSRWFELQKINERFRK